MIRSRPASTAASLAEVDDEDEYHVEDVLDSRLFGRWRKLQYLIRWTGCDSPTWGDAAGVDGLQAIDGLHALYPLKPGPLPPAAAPPGLDAASLSFAGAQRLGGGHYHGPSRVTPGRVWANTE